VVVAVAQELQADKVAELTVNQGEITKVAVADHTAQVLEDLLLQDNQDM
jgi:hypothetical protein